jgi:hypothetical protein
VHGDKGNQGCHGKKVDSPGKFMATQQVVQESELDRLSQHQS